LKFLFLPVFFRCLTTATFAEENAGRAYQHPSTGKIPGHFKADWEHLPCDMRAGQTLSLSYQLKMPIANFAPMIIMF
jgi:hypothetical protein